MALEHTRQEKTARVFKYCTHLLLLAEALRTIDISPIPKVVRVKTLLLQILFPKGGVETLWSKKDGKLKAAACEAAALAPLLQESEQKPNLPVSAHLAMRDLPRTTWILNPTFHEESPSSGMDVDAKGK